MTTMIERTGQAMGQKLQLLLHNIGIDVSPTSNECIVEGVPFRLTGLGPLMGVVMVGTCPDCDELNESGLIFSLADVGMLIKAFEPSIGHKCKPQPSQSVTDLETRIKALEFMTKGQTEMVNREFSDRIKALEDQAKESKNRLGTLAYDHSNLRSHTSEELHDFWLKDAKQDGRLNAIVGKQKEMEAALSRYQDTHAETHRYIHVQMREFGECDVTLLKASEKQQARLDTLERRGDGLQETCNE